MNFEKQNQTSPWLGAGYSRVSSSMRPRVPSVVVVNPAVVISVDLPKSLRLKRPAHVDFDCDWNSMPDNSISDVARSESCLRPRILRSMREPWRGWKELIEEETGSKSRPGLPLYNPQYLRVCRIDQIISSCHVVGTTHVTSMDERNGGPNSKTSRFARSSTVAIPINIRRMARKLEHVRKILGKMCES